MAFRTHRGRRRATPGTTAAWQFWWFLETAVYIRRANFLSSKRLGGNVVDGGLMGGGALLLGREDRPFDPGLLPSHRR